MKTKLCSLLIVSLFASLAAAQDEKSDGMEMQMPKPTKAHSVLKKEVGEWEAEVQVWMSPDGDPVKSKGKETVKMMGEFWTISHFEFEFMGKPAFGHGTFGYDPNTKKYTGTWHDLMSPWPARMMGTYDESKKTMTYMMDGKDITGKDQKSKIIVTYNDEKTKTFEMHSPVPGSDKLMKTVQIVYKKK